MASTYAKRLQKLEEQMASRINQPLAHVWVEAGETREEAIVRAGYDLSQADRIKTIRWMTPEEGKLAAPKPWDQPHEPGPPKDDLHRSVEPEARPAQFVTPDPEMQSLSEDPLTHPVPVDPVEEDIDRRAARRLLNEKLFEATKAFSKTIV
jgi:hypothetical protein